MSKKIYTYILQFYPFILYFKPNTQHSFYCLQSLLPFHDVVCKWAGGTTTEHALKGNLHKTEEIHVTNSYTFIFKEISAKFPIFKLDDDIK